MHASQNQLPTEGPSHVCPHPLAVNLASADQNGAIPWHLWAVGALTLIWYALGLGQLGLMEAGASTASIWSQASLALCLCAGFGGAALLLLRSRYAVQALVVALVGVMATSLDKFVFASEPASLYADPAVLGLWLIAQASLFYGLRIRALGLLR